MNLIAAIDFIISMKFLFQFYLKFPKHFIIIFLIEDNSIYRYYFSNELRKLFPIFFFSFLFVLFKIEIYSQALFAHFNLIHFRFNWCWHYIIFLFSFWLLKSLNYYYCYYVNILIPLHRCIRSTFIAFSKIVVSHLKAKKTKYFVLLISYLMCFQ